MHQSRWLWLGLGILLASVLAPGACLDRVWGASLAASEIQVASATRFELTFTEKVSAEPFTGRVLVFLGRSGEPRRGPNWFNPEPFFALDVKDWQPGTAIVLDHKAQGFPKPLDQLAEGSYRIQAVLDLDRGTHRVGTGPGNAHSAVVQAKLPPDDGAPIKLTIDQLIPERAFNENERVKLCELVSPSLSAFHKKPMKLRAGVVLPPSFHEQPGQRYPVIYDIPGFGGDHTFAFMYANRRANVADGVEFLYVVLDPDCRTGHHVFADSENNGPYGTALVTEFIPHLEQAFRGLNQPSARFVTGHSSGGWSSLWLQVTYPNAFGGVWSTAPDPIDFRDFQRINLYAPGANMFKDEAGQPRPLARRGQTPVVFYRAFSDMERVLGRGGQLASFEAVFSPRMPNGQPRLLWDRDTGAVDPVTAKAWEKYDINLVLERNWSTLEPKLRGKLHVYMGELDTFYLEGATIKVKETLARLGSDAKVEIFPGKDHGSLLGRDLIQRMAKEMADQFRNHQPREQP
ncbi:MAG TPA: alpha/beta hydrolase-fold protein [Gemmatales bacterium]|nr:alpha/beta hydrolase-fold protein [Gemmatales bacterium]HMP58230.1 alpha/beta hydrolase-fold protein [Gemmatales bacterium]